ncbi:hypothetical protein OHB41_19335 [Streptomyces sp. NBC_01571]|uniref:hypothetical protein n=1 Tax=Streptomyces sp. NBC_01571 TaxID=2975883 RepID=UPI00225BD505|nr:hypothetical protein [Streptomyces sp. NBC_01571]MCX4575301.1 hypothetical protein [Streptomyces sp. NBC_01571]
MGSEPRGEVEGRTGADRPAMVGGGRAAGAQRTGADRPADASHRSAAGGPPRSGPRAAFATVPWERPEEPDHTHDPHEVTVQLDGAGRRLEDQLVDRTKAAPGVPDSSDGPVFVDESGRRSRRFRRLGILVGVACAVYAVVIVATLLSGNSNAPWLPVPGQEDDPPAGQVHTSPLPTDSVKPSDAGSGVTPGASAAVSDGTTPAAGVAPTPAASGSAVPSGTSVDPKPSASTTTKPKPSASTTKEPVVEPSLPVSSPPDPSPSVDPSAGTSESPAAGGAGTVADGPVEPHPLDLAPGTTGTPSPENLV